MQGSTVHHYRLAISAAIASSVLSSLAWVYQGEAVRYLSPFVTVCFINLISAGILFFYLWYRRTLPAWSDFSGHRRDLLVVTLIRPLIGGALYCYALTMTSGLKLMFFTKMEPYIVLFLAWMLERYRISIRQLVLLAVHVAAAILLSTNGTFVFDEAQYGDLIVLGTVALVACSYAPAARLARSVGALRVNMVSMAIGGFLQIPFALALAPMPFTEMETAGWINLIIGLLLFQVFGLSFWYFSMRSIPGWLASALRAVGPVLAAPVAWLFFDQHLSLFQILAAALVLLTSAMIARENRPV